MLDRFVITFAACQRHDANLSKYIPGNSMYILIPTLIDIQYHCYLSVLCYDY